MSSDTLRYVGTDTLTLGVDGNRPVAVLGDDGCCPDPLCLDYCATACSFVDLLPSGPLWDSAKAQAQAQLISGGDVYPCEPLAGCNDSDYCPTMVDVGIFGAKMLMDAVTNTIWPAIRETNPNTAVTTLDDWLDRYNWQDCYRSHCRSGYIANLSPYEVSADCGPTYCETNYPPEFECALKRATLLSLVRAHRGVIKNLDGLNWVIAPLGVTIAPREPLPTYVQDIIDGGCDEEGDGPACFCDEVELELCASSAFIDACPDQSSPCRGAVAKVAALQRYVCGDIDIMLYPSVLTAECIVRSLLPKQCPNILYRCDAVAI